MSRWGRSTDSAGITVEYVPIECIKPGALICEGWKPWPEVTRIAQYNGKFALVMRLYSIHDPEKVVKENHYGTFQAAGTLVPVFVSEEEVEPNAYL